MSRRRCFRGSHRNGTGNKKAVKFDGFFSLLAAHLFQTAG